MAVDSLLSWLNNDFDLYKPVTNIERDLSDGYVFALLLHQAGFEPSIEKYQPADPFASSSDTIKIRNMCLLEKRLRDLGQNFLQDVRHRVLMGDSIAIRQVLEKLRSFITRDDSAATYQNNAENLLEPAKSLASCKTQRKKKAFLRYLSETFEPAELGRESEIDMALHLSRFHENRRILEGKSAQFREEEARVNHERLLSRQRTERSRFRNARNKKKERELSQREDWKKQEDIRTLNQQSANIKERKLDELRKAIHGIRMQSMTENAIADFQENMGKSLPDSDAQPGSGKRMISKPSIQGYRTISEKRVHQVQIRDETIEVSEESSFDSSDDAAAICTDRNEADGEVDAVEGIYHNVAESEVVPTDTRMRDSSEYLRLEGVKRLRECKEAYQKYLNDREKNKKPELYLYCSEVLHAIIELSHRSQTHRINLRREILHEDFRRLYFRHVSMDAEPASISTFGNFCKAELVNAHFIADACINRPSSYDIVSDSKTQEMLRAIKPENLLATTCLEWLDNINNEPDIDLVHFNQMNQFKIVTVYTDKLHGQDLAQKVAKMHKMHYLSFAVIIDLFSTNISTEVVTFEAINDGLKDILKPFSSNIMPYMQKKLPIPEALSVEVMMTAIHWCMLNQDELIGCILLNYPRSVGETVQLETNLAIKLIEDDESRVSALSKLEINASHANDDAADSECLQEYVLQSISAVLILDCKDAANTEAEESVDHADVINAKTAVSSQYTCHQFDDKVARLWKRCSRFIEIPLGTVHDAVTLETIGLWIEQLTHEGMKSVTLHEPDSAKLQHILLEKARIQKRSSLELADQFYWGYAAKDFHIDAEDVALLQEEIATVTSQGKTHLSFYFASIHKKFESLLSQCCSTRKELLTKLSIGNSLDSKLEEAYELGKCLAVSEHHDICTLLELKLGDIIDGIRIMANKYVDGISDPSVSVTYQNLGGLSNECIKLVYPICQTLLKRAIGRIQTFGSKLFRKIPILQKSDSSQVLVPMSVRESFFVAFDKVYSISDDLGKENLYKILHNVEKHLQILPYDCSAEDDTNFSAREQLYEDRVIQNEISQLMQQMTYVCEWIFHMISLADIVVAEEIEICKSIVNNDTKRKFEDLVHVMDNFKQQILGKSNGSFVFKNSTDASMPFCLLEIYLTIHQRAALLTFTQIELMVEHLLAKTGEEICKIDFTEAVVYCSAKHQFPDVWRSTLNIVALAEAFSKHDEIIDWRRFVLSIVRIHVTNMPTIEEVEVDCKNWISQACSTSNENNICDVLACEFTLQEFIGTRAWFDKSVEERYGLEMVQQVKKLLFKTIAKCSDNEPQQNKNDLSCTLQSIIWQLSSHFTDFTFEFPFLWVHENAMQATKEHELLAQYCVGAVKATSCVLLFKGLLRHATDELEVDELVPHETAITALSFLLRRISTNHTECSNSQVSESLKTVLLYLNHRDNTYYNLASDCASQFPDIGTSFILVNPYASLTAQ